MEGEAQASADLVRKISTPIYEARVWLKLVGVLSIISGLFIAITIIGIIVAWLPIWMGVLLFQAASQTESAHTSGDTATLIEGLGKLRTYFIVTGVLTLLGLLWTVFWIFMAGAIGILGATGGF